MALTASTWLMTEAQSLGRGYYSRDIIGDVPFGIVTGTERRDVSEQLDLLAQSDTPFINSISWGPESGGNSIEWISEDLGPGKLKLATSLVSDQVSMALTSIDGLAASDTLYQVKQGSVLYTFISDTSASHLLAVVTSTPAAAGTGATIFVSWIEGTCTSTASGQMVYVLGAFANEGSIPNIPMPRQRVVCSNNFTILREDVQITGSMRATDMYAIGREDRHQILMRMKELQRNRERAALYSIYKAKTSVIAGLINGCLGFLLTQTGTHIDTSTYTLTNTKLNAMVSALWEYGADRLTFFGSQDQCAKITRWDVNRIRMRPNDRVGGGVITSWMSEANIEVDIAPMRHVPENLAFVLDTDKISLHAKRGRKAIMEKLGKMGDFEDWQILSEFSLKMQGWNLRQHGLFTVLT